MQLYTSYSYIIYIHMYTLDVYIHTLSTYVYIYIHIVYNYVCVCASALYPRIYMVGYPHSLLGTAVEIFFQVYCAEAEGLSHQATYGAFPK